MLLPSYNAIVADKELLSQTHQHKERHAFKIKILLPFPVVGYRVLSINHKACRNPDKGLVD